MLASDSDSEFEFANNTGHGNGSEASDDEGILLGKLALGIDPQEMKSYDVKSEPKNGSQYLMQVMAEKKAVPKVVSVGVPEPKPKQGVNYLDKFLQLVSNGEENNLTVLPTQKWRDETLANFSEIRSKVEKWQHLIESKAVRHSPPVQLPTTTDANHWLKFCFGDAFMKLVTKSKTASKEEKLTDFFVNLHDQTVSTDIVQEKLEAESEEQSQEEKAPVNGATLPLISTVLHLHPQQVESLIKWNVSWIQNLGFVNKSQGQWLYALLSCVVKPVDPSTMSDLRSIARTLIKSRNKFSDDWKEYFDKIKGEESTEEEKDTPLDYVNSLNLFIYLIADYFAQKDLIASL